MNSSEFGFLSMPFPPIWQAISDAYDRALCYSSPWTEELEVFLNPADATVFPPDTRIMEMPLKTSIGVPEGRVFIFDRRRMRYLPDGVLTS
jgi:hypothetical protein